MDEVEELEADELERMGAFPLCAVLLVVLVDLLWELWGAFCCCVAPVLVGVGGGQVVGPVQTRCWMNSW
jgi:hypothetical protein